MHIHSTLRVHVPVASATTLLDVESSLVKDKRAKEKKEKKKKEKRREENWIRVRVSKRERKKKTIKDGSVFYKLTIVLIINYFYIHFTDGNIRRGISFRLINKKKKKSGGEKRMEHIFFYISGGIFL